MPMSPELPSTVPLGKGVTMGKSEQMGTGLSRIRAETCLAACRLVMNRPCLLAQASTENFRLMSVAVVMTGVAPRTSASFRASSLPPPMCPESRQMEKLPSSSTATTAGSVSLLFTWGAISRTAMPQEPTKMKASAQSNSGP